MDGRAFLEVAKELAAGPTEAHWRSAAGRAYYSLFQEGLAALERWGFALPPRHPVHAFVRLRFSYPADADLKAVGDALDRLGRLRNQADYQLASPGPFASAQRAHNAIFVASVALARLDQLDNDSARRGIAIAAIRAAWP